VTTSSAAGAGILCCMMGASSCVIEHIKRAARGAATPS